MNLEPKICYQALLTHDRRFDGVFFIGVRSTHIYCRPVCTVKIPLEKNCTFHASAAAAEQAGFRPCLRCRPELAPGSAIIDSSGRLAAVISRSIEDGALSENTVAELAEQLGISERHLRRIVDAEFGVSPIDLAQTQRLLLAKRLLTDTNLPITDIAFASGFASVRRFNVLFKERYKLNPTQLRKTGVNKASTDMLRFELGYRPPLDWDSLVKFLAMRTAGGAETFQNDKLLRTVQIGDSKGWLEAAPHPDKPVIVVHISNNLSRVLLPLLTKLRRLFDLDADPHAISQHLGTLSVARPGLRVPGAFDGFELGARAILGQQVSVKGASTLMTRFVEAFGSPIETPHEELTHISPTAKQVAKLTPETIAEKVKIPLVRARAINELGAAPLLRR